MFANNTTDKFARWFWEAAAPTQSTNQEDNRLKATGIVRRIDDLGRVVIPKEIRRTMRIREGDPSQIMLTQFESYCLAMTSLGERRGASASAT